MEEGKFAEASKLTRLIASAQNRLDAANNSRSQLAIYKQQAEAAAHQAQNDPLSGYSEPAKDWIRKHPAFLSDPKYRARVIAADSLCRADDVELDSPEYFRRLNEAITPKQKATVVDETQTDDEYGDDMEQPTVKVTPQRQQTRMSTALPVTRQGSQSGTVGGGRRIQLTADQAEAAVISFPNLSPQEAYKRYADNMKRLKEEGKI